MEKLSVFRVLEEFERVQERLEPGLFILALLSSLAASYAAAAMYRFFYESRGTGSQVHRSFPLLGISITTLFIGVQLSIPLSLGLLGALSIIRFRTPIKEPEEVGFIMLVIASSISAATFNFRHMVMLFVVAVASLALTRAARGWKFLKRDGVMVITMADADVDGGMSRVRDYLKAHIRRNIMESSSSRDGVSSFQMAFSGLKTDVSDLQAGLRKVAPIQTINVFLDRPGGIR